MGTVNGMTGHTSVTMKIVYLQEVITVYMIMMDAKKILKGAKLTTDNIKRTVRKETYSIKIDPVKMKKLRALLKRESIKQSDFFDECLTQFLKGK